MGTVSVMTDSRKSDHAQPTRIPPAYGEAIGAAVPVRLSARRLLYCCRYRRRTDDSSEDMEVMTSAPFSVLTSAWRCRPCR